MLGSRRGRPSLIGRAAQTAARTAVITATATTVAGKAAARQAPGAPTPAAAEPPRAGGCRAGERGARATRRSPGCRSSPSSTAPAS